MGYMPIVITKSVDIDYIYQHVIVDFRDNKWSCHGNGLHNIQMFIFLQCILVSYKSQLLYYNACTVFSNLCVCVCIDRYVCLHVCDLTTP